MRDPERLDGWKAIAAHFGRDRTTAIRWSQERGLPVHAFPGGKTRTVYALRSELDAWARQSEASDPVTPAPATPRDALPDTGTRQAGVSRYVALPIGLFVAVSLIGTVYLAGAHRGSTQPPLPRDPATARLLVQARDDWAQRTGPSLVRAVAELRQVTSRAPGFAPAFADLADAYVLSREAGSLPDEIAFPQARAAAERAVALDPRLAAAYRALGFVAYWWSNDRAAAAHAFRRALQLDPADAQTHFWLANILADNGEDAAALREFDAARLADPGSPQIGADYAWALWSAGQDREALARLKAIVAANPTIAEAHDCLATVLLAGGDARGYLEERAIVERLRGQRSRVGAFEAVLADGGKVALLRALMREAMADQARSPHPDHAEAAFDASLAGERGDLLAVLAQADRLQEQWGSAGMVRRIAARWAGDAQVEAALARRRSPLLEPLLRG